jgi:hypothetical protein
VEVQRLLDASFNREEAKMADVYNFHRFEQVLSEG